MKRKSTITPVVVAIAAVAVVLSLCGCSKKQSARQAARTPATEPNQAKSFIYKGPAPKEFHEAPMLAEQVKAGKLPPVKDRVSDEPMVIPVVERIGTYGGTWHRAFTGPSDFQNMDRLEHDLVLYYDLDGKTIVPHIAKAWEVSEDGKVFTLHLRPGMKWSDGAPFTSEDFLFAYEDIGLNSSINPRKPPFLRIRSLVDPSQNVYGTIEAPDPLTVRMVFPEPKYIISELFASHGVSGQCAKGWDAPPYAPKHYLKQFHPRYAGEEKLNEMARAKGFKNWIMLFQTKARLPENPDLPTVGPWRTVAPITGQLFVLERNPYYWAVDPNGNQLPYIDRIEMRLCQDLEVLNMRAMASEIDMQHRHIQMAKYPALKEAAKKGNYRIYLWPGLGGSEAAFAFNQDWQGDAEIRKWLRNRDFRVALSLATDRNQINELIFMGLGTPRPFMAVEGTTYFPGKEFEKENASYDVAKANAMLDALGLTARDAEGFRLRSDGGGRIVLTVSVMTGAFLDFAAIAELVERQWSKVGIKLNISMEDRTLWTMRRDTAEQQLNLWDVGGAENLWTYGAFAVPIGRGCPFAPGSGMWYETNGLTGNAPEGDVKRLAELYAQGMRVPLEKRLELGREIWRIHARNVFMLGTVGNSAAFNGVVIVKNNFHNVPRIAPNSSSLQNPGIARPEQFFIEEP